MSASLTTSLDNAANPLDIMEQIVAANEWEFDRRSDFGNGGRGTWPLVRLRLCFSTGRTKSA